MTGREGGNLVVHVSKCTQGRFLLGSRTAERGLNAGGPASPPSMLLSTCSSFSQASSPPQSSDQDSRQVSGS